MYQVSADEIQDIKEAHDKILEYIKSLKENYSYEVIGGALLMNFVEMIHAKSKDKEHFLSYKEQFCELMDLDANIFYG